MVAPNRELGNKHCFTHNIASNGYMNMDVDGFNNLFENISDNFNEVVPLHKVHTAITNKILTGCDTGAE